MAEKLTPQQYQAVTDRGGNLLVSAAAGSGKTKVLVDRLMGYLTDPVSPANLDEFLIITYTKAAASELRGKIASKLTERIAAEPENSHLRQQLQRLYLTKISTVHAFCADILREYAFKMDIPADFRVAEENECIEIQTTVLDKLLDEAYKDVDDQDFAELINTQGLGRDDRQILEIILKVYNSARCHLDPSAWLEWCVSLNDVNGITDASETIWGKYLIDDLHHYIGLQMGALEKCAAMAVEYGDMQKPADVLYATIDQLREICACSKWDDIVERMHVDYGRLTFPKSCSDSDVADKIRSVRDACKKGLAKKFRKFSGNSAQILNDLGQIAAVQRALVSLVRKFGVEYDNAKKRKRVLDFSDLEQSTLDLLLGAKRTGYTAVATEIGRRYREVMVDEYQDSNAVQDAIFAAITHKKQNCFMVGDVKQSIYQFRLADPGIFIEKYNSYVPADMAKTAEGRKVLLSRNFRSSAGVIGAVNDVFSACMTEKVGGLDYGADEFLYEGIPHTLLNEEEIELYTIDVQEDTYEEEASFVAERIAQLLDGTHMVRQGDILRPIVPEDIVILLRSPGSVGRRYVSALEEKGIRCATGAGTDLLRTEEIETLRAILQIIDNPLQDIPLISALSSRVFCFTADDLAEIRAARPGGSFFSALRDSQCDKARNALEIINNLRNEARISSLPKLLQTVFAQTQIDSIYAALPDGDLRNENLQSFYQLACDADSGGAKGLPKFLDYLNALEEKGLVLADDKSAAGAVTIMSIHKSKGLEFPVVFLCGLSREFNQESSRAQILCDKDLGLGLSCVDNVNRVRYPSIAKRAIAAKITAESISEEMRVLYVAMTRPRDRLIMTYASRNIQAMLSDLSFRMNICDPYLMTADVDCPGKWVLLTALKHKADKLWAIQSATASASHSEFSGDNEKCQPSLPPDMDGLRNILSYSYPYKQATVTPSKQTATQLKGRLKDKEAAQDTDTAYRHPYSWRKPAFLQQNIQGKNYGQAVHTVMQFIDFDACKDTAAVQTEITRLVNDGYISQECGETVNPKDIAAFFSSEIGAKIRAGENVLREFKFSLLDNGEKYGSDLRDENVLLQGVVDCALVEDDGITIVDFKTDRVTDDTLDSVVDRYRLQVEVYASALERIYDLPIKSKQLYFFALNKFVAL